MINHESMEETGSKAWLSGVAYGLTSGTAQLPYALLRFITNSDYQMPKCFC